MKEIEIFQQKNALGLFDNQSTEPVLVKNSTGRYFLVFPVEKNGWKELFFQLYQLPSDLFSNKNKSKKRDMQIVNKICGSYKDFLSDSDKFSELKQAEKINEEKKWRQ